MRQIHTFIISTVILLLMGSCENGGNQFDASGAFEAEEVIISAEAMGRIMELNIEEGQILKTGQVIGYVDSTQLFLKKKQLEAQIEAVMSNKPNVSVQLSALQKQLNAATNERKRIENLLKADVATQKQLDDVNTQIEVIKSQMSALKSTLSNSTDNINKNASTLSVQIEQINDQLEKCKIVNPMAGTVLTKYAMANEMGSPGKPIYKIADLSSIILRVYVSGNQLPEIKLNQKVKVNTDDGQGGFNESEGTITWINNKAEFTPKTIQTKDERANMVYAVKVKVKNDGRYKIGMYGELMFN